jgi:hypothetical protein
VALRSLKSGLSKISMPRLGRITAPALSLAGAALAAAVLAAGPAGATETAIPVTPSGGTDVNQALLPAPGLYGAFITLPFNQAGRLYDVNGKAAPDSGNVRFSIPTIALGLSYVYPVKVFGGAIESSLVLPFAFQTYGIGTSPDGHNTGVGDLYADLLTWSRHVDGTELSGGPNNSGLTVAAGMAMKMPTGAYSRKNPINVGNNVFVFVPNAAATYTARGIPGVGDDTQFSTKVFYGVPTQNPASRYQSGNVMAVDFSASEAIGRLRLGFAGTFSNQTTDDRLPDGTTPPDGKKFQQLQVGPVMTYAIPNTPVALKFKYLRTIYVRNDIDDQFLLASLAMKF